MSYVALATTTLGTGGTGVVFSSIPATYRDLIVVVNGGRTSGGDSLHLRFNGDTGANYNWVQMGARTTWNSQTQGANTSFITLGWDSFIWNRFDYVATAQIMDYAVTDKHKPVLVRGNRGSGDSGVDAIAGRWINTAAITSVSVTNFGTSLAGTTISLYGIAG